MSDSMHILRPFVRLDVTYLQYIYYIYKSVACAARLVAKQNEIGYFNYCFSLPSFSYLLFINRGLASLSKAMSAPFSELQFKYWAEFLLIFAK